MYVHLESEKEKREKWKRLDKGIYLILKKNGWGDLGVYFHRRTFDSLSSCLSL